MDTGYSWKRTQEAETDLKDLLCRLLRQWKQIAVCAVISAAVLGGYGRMQEKTQADTAPASSEEEAGTVLTQAEEQGVSDALQLENEIRNLEEYMEQSVLMQTDPYHKARCVMLYRIDRAAWKELAAVAESYVNFTANGGAADALIQSGSWKMDKSCLAELVSAYQKTYSSPYQIAAEEAAAGGLLSETLFYVETTGRDAKTAKKMADDIHAALRKYSAQVKKNAGSHRLKLVSSVESITADSGLLAQQREKKALLSSDREKLKALLNSFSSKQKAAYFNKADSVLNEEKLEAVPAAAARESIKYVVLGFGMGIFIYCGLYVCFYLFRDTVKSTEEIKRTYTFPVFGGITSLNSCEREKVQILNRIRLLCKKQGIRKLYAVSDFSFCEKEAQCIKSIAEQLSGWGIETVIGENGDSNTALWDDMTEAGYVLLIWRLGTTTHRMADEELAFYTENDITAVGVVTFG